MSTITAFGHTFTVGDEFWLVRTDHGGSYRHVTLTEIDNERLVVSDGNYIDLDSYYGEEIVSDLLNNTHATHRWMLNEKSSGVRFTMQCLFFHKVDAERFIQLHLAPELIRRIERDIAQYERNIAFNKELIENLRNAPDGILKR